MTLDCIWVLLQWKRSTTDMSLARLFGKARWLRPHKALGTVLETRDGDGIDAVVV